MGMVTPCSASTCSKIINCLKNQLNSMKRQCSDELTWELDYQSHLEVRNAICQ